MTVKQIKPKKVTPKSHYAMSNTLAIARRNLPVSEEKILHTAISIARDTKGYSHETPIEIQLDNYAELTELNHRAALMTFMRAAKSLQSRVIFLPTTSNTGREATMGINLFHSVIYAPLDGYLQIRFHEAVAEHFVRIEGAFVGRHLINILKLKTTHAINLYNLLCTDLWKVGGGRKEYERDELKALLGVASKYKNIKDFHSEVLDKTIKQIVAHTDLSVTVTNKMRGRRVVGYQFNITDNSTKVIESKEDDSNTKTPTIPAKTNDKQGEGEIAPKHRWTAPHSKKLVALGVSQLKVEALADEHGVNIGTILTNYAKYA